MLFNNVLLVGHKTKQGKDTFADYLMASAIVPVERLQFSDTMKDIMAEMFDMSREQLEEVKNLGDPMRGYHQRFGSGKMKELFGEDVWVQKLIEKVTDKDTIYIIDDFRFPIEALPGAISIKLVRPLGDVKLFDHEHISETALDDYDFDYTIINDGTLDDLANKAADFMCELGLGL